MKQLCPSLFYRMSQSLGTFGTCPRSQEWRSRNLRPSCLFPKPVQYTATGSIRKDYQPHKSSAVSLRCGNSGDLSRVHLAYLFIESWGAPSPQQCTVLVNWPRVPTGHLCVPPMYTSQYACVTSQGTVSTHLCTTLILS